MSNIFNWFKGLWETNKDKVAKAICVAIEGYRPQLKVIVLRYIKDNTAAEAIVKEIAEGLEVYVKRQI